MEVPESSEDFNHVDALLVEVEQVELNKLRQDQIEGRDWTEEKRARFLELSKKEEMAREKRKMQN